MFDSATTSSPVSDRGIRLYVHNKLPVSLTSFNSSNVELFAHCAAYAMETVVDLQLDGLSPIKRSQARR